MSRFAVALVALVGMTVALGCGCVQVSARSQSEKTGELDRAASRDPGQVGVEKQ